MDAESESNRQTVAGILYQLQENDKQVELITNELIQLQKHQQTLNVLIPQIQNKHKQIKNSLHAENIFIQQLNNQLAVDAVAFRQNQTNQQQVNDFVNALEVQTGCVENSVQCLQTLRNADCIQLANNVLIQNNQQIAEIRQIVI